MSEQLTIETPENVELTYDLAGVGSRCIAALLDHLLILAALAAVLLFSLLIASGSVIADLFVTGDQGQFEMNTQGFAFAFLAISWFVIIWGYFLFFETRSNGQSPGKKVSRLRVVRDDGGPVTFWDVLLRTLLRPVDFLPFGYFLGMTAMLINRRCKRLGNLAAGTIIIRMRKDEGPSGFVLAPRPEREEEIAELKRTGVHRLTSGQIQLALTFLRRRDALDSMARRHLASEVAAPLAQQLKLEFVDAEVFLENVVVAHGQQTETAGE